MSHRHEQSRVSSVGMGNNMAWSKLKLLDQRCQILGVGNRGVVSNRRRVLIWKTIAPAVIDHLGFTVVRTARFPVPTFGNRPGHRERTPATHRVRAPDNAARHGLRERLPAALFGQRSSGKTSREQPRAIVASHSCSTNVRQVCRISRPVDTE